MEEYFESDKVQLLAPFSAVIMGRSGSGKSLLLRDIISNWKFCTNGKRIYRFCLIHTQYQPLFDDIINCLDDGTIVEVFDKPPSNLDILYRASPDPNSVSLICIDDCQNILENPKNPLFDFVMNIIRVKSHHNRVCVIVLLQDTLRDRNTKLLSQINYLFLTPTFGGNSLTSQIQRILFTGSKGLIRGVCEQAFENDDCDSLLIDSHPMSDYRLRFRGNGIKASSAKPSLVYVPNY